MSEVIHLEIEADKMDLSFGGVKLNDASKIIELVKENDRLKAALQEIVDECQQAKVYATEIQEKMFIDEVEQTAKYALAPDSGKGKEG